MTYTKGPWRVYRESQEMTIKGRVHQICDYDGFPSAFVPSWEPPDEEEALGNAKLIAAAPDMLEALSDGCDALEHAIMQLPKDANQRLGMEGALKRMAQAITKAEGK